MLHIEIALLRVAGIGDLEISISQKKTTQVELPQLPLTAGEGKELCGTMEKQNEGAKSPAD